MARWSLEGTKPDWFPSDKQRYIVATDEGWVYEYRYTDALGNTKVHREVLVSIPGLGDSVDMGAPSISEIYVANSSGGDVLRRGTTLKVHVVYDEPLTGAATGWTLAVANTDGTGSNGVTATGGSTLANANNTLVFSFSANNAGPYKVNSQTVSNTTNAVLSLNANNESVSRVISDAVSNTLGIFDIVREPVVTAITAANSTGGATLKAGQAVHLAVLFDHSLEGTYTGWSLAVSNTSSVEDDNVVATGYSVSGNTLTLSFTANTAGDYSVAAQNMSNTADNLFSGDYENMSINRAISSGVGATLGTLTLS